MFKKNILQINIALALTYMTSSAFAACVPSTGPGGETVCTFTEETVYSLPNPLPDHLIINNANSGVFTPSPQGHGLYINNNVFTLKDLTVSVAGGQADAIRTNGGSTVNITGKVIVNATGSSSDAINATEDSAATVNIGDNAELYASSGIAVRANLSKIAGRSNIINVGNNAKIVTLGSGGNFIDGVGYAVYAGIRSWAASNTPGDARVNIGDNSQISTQGLSAHAVYANRGGVIQLGSTQITTSGNSAHGIYAQTGSSGGSNRSSHIGLLGDTTVAVTGTGAYAIYADGAGSVVASKNVDTGVVTSGIYNVTGNMQVNNGGTIDLVMNNTSLFNGNTTISNSGGTLNLKIDGANSHWRMNDNSQLTTLDLTRNANVHVGDQTVALNGATPNNTTLTMAHLKGTNGIFHLRTDIIGTGLGVQKITDFIKVTGTSQGSHKIHVNDQHNGGAVNDGSEIIQVVETADGLAEFSLLNGTVDIGAYQYDLVRGDSVLDVRQNWWLKGSPRRTTTANHSGNILNLNYLLNRAENQTLLQRMGEIRRADLAEGDAWVRTYLGKMSSFEDGSFGDFDFNYHGVQIGADKYLGKDFYLGVMMGFAKGDADYEIGDGNAESHHLGLYGTYKTESGWYIDSIAKLVYMKNKFDSVTSGGYAVEGVGSSNGYSAGLEVGKRFYFVQDNGFYVEPQLQFTYSHQSKSDVKATNGLKTRLDSYESKEGRASLVMGYNVASDVNPVDIYVKTGYVKEFDGKTGYTFNDTVSEKYRFKGDMWDNGIGVSAQINKVHNIYVEGSYGHGRKFDSRQANLGYRFNF